MRRPSWFAVEAFVVALLLAAALLIDIVDTVRGLVGG